MHNPDIERRAGAMVVHDGETIVYADESFLALCGLASRDSVVGTDPREYVSAPDRGPLGEQFARVEAGEAPTLGLTVTVSDDTGFSRELVALTSPIEWDGQTRLQTLFLDTESALSARLATSAMDHSPTGISVADARSEDEPLVYVNDTFVELTGYPREEALGRNCRFLQGPETRDEPVARLREAIENREPVTVELRNYRADGTMFWNRVSVRPVTDGEGDVTHFLGFQEDISARKVYEQEKTLFQMQADAVDKSVFITDAEGIIQYVNPQFERATGYTAEEVIGKTPRVLNAGAQDEAFWERLWETITAGEIWEATITNRRKSGERYSVEQKIVPAMDADGEVTHFVAIEEDITDREFTEQVLDVMSRVLRHNVRNSVSAIQGYAELLERDADDIDRTAALQTIQRQAANLERISERSQDVRELFRRRNGEQPLTVAALREFLDGQRTRYPDATIDVSVAVDPALTIPNGSLLELAIEEGVENAVVHSDSEHPRVDIAVTRCAKTDELCIEVADEGPGIPDDIWTAISTGQETPLAHGNGVGLWLMHWAMTALGGTLERDANDLRGTVVTYRVPLGSGERSDSP